LVLALVAVVGAGCVPSLRKNPPRPLNTGVPANYTRADGAVVPVSLDGSSSGQMEWADFFTDPDLTALVETALRNNQELNVRLQEIIIAQSKVLEKRGEYLPKIDAVVGGGIERVGRFTSQGASDEATGLATNLQNYVFGFVASWEVDVWRKMRNAADAANHRYLSSIEGRNFMVTELVADIANSYYELLALDNQADVLRRNIEIQQDALEVVKTQFQAAQVTQLAVQRFEAEVLKNKSRQYDLEQRRIETENHINFLVGRFPQHVDRRSRIFEQALPNVIRAGIPAQLLDNRPDLRAASQAVTAAEFDVKSAKAGFYPRLSVQAGVGYEAFNLRHLVMTPESLAYNAAANMATPILNRRAIKAEYFAANAEQIRAVYDYERTILEAVTEVTNLLNMMKNLEQSYDLRERQVTELEQAIEVSGVLFQSARADYMEVLLTRRDALDAEMELIETKRQQLRAMVDVYQALGGGWRQDVPFGVQNAEADPQVVVPHEDPSVVPPS